MINIMMLKVEAVKAQGILLNLFGTGTFPKKNGLPI